MSKAKLSLKSIVEFTDSEGAKSLHRLAGIGGILGVLAALIGLATALSGVSQAPGSALLLPFQGAQIIPYVEDSTLVNTTAYMASAAFMAIIGISMLLQYLGGKRVGTMVSSGYYWVMMATAIISFYAAYIFISASGVNISASSRVAAYVESLVLPGFLFVILWQFCSVFYIDTSKSYIGLIAGLCTGLFIPLLAAGHVTTSLAPLIPLSYVFLLVGQFMSIFYWWRPSGHIREYARSTPTAKIGFAISGVLTFVIGLIPMTISSLTMIDGVLVWTSWSAYTTYKSLGYTYFTFPTPPWAILSLTSVMIVWLMLSPRLGAKELKKGGIREDIITGGFKWFMLFWAILGILASVVCGALYSSNTAFLQTLTLFLSLGPAAVMFLMGATYMSNNDILTGLPMAVISVFLMTQPVVIATFVTTLWGLIIVTQVLLAIEIFIRGNTVFSQSFLTVVTTIAASLLFIMFMVGGFGSGPAVTWPANRWFNIQLFAGIPVEVQAPTVFTITILSLLIRNLALTGYAYGRRYSEPGILIAISLIFTLMINIISGSVGAVHKALTAAALTFALYTISYVNVLTLNLSLGKELVKQGHLFEGNFIRIGVAMGIAIGAAVAVVALSTLSGFPDATMIANVVTLMMMLIVSIEIISIISWLSAGIRLGLIRGGFKFVRAKAEL